MVIISEWLPNPVGADAGSEWLELFNDSAPAVFLSGWRVENGSGKGVKLSDLQIGPGEYLVLHRKDTKLTLRNRDEALSLYNARGELVYRAEFLGSAPEGKSISWVGNEFVVTEPTPGAANPALVPQVAALSYPWGSALNPQVETGGVLGLALSAGIIVAAVITFAVKQHGRLSELLFGGDKETGSSPSEGPYPQGKIPF